MKSQPPVCVPGPPCTDVSTCGPAQPQPRAPAPAGLRFMGFIGTEGASGTRTQRRFHSPASSPPGRPSSCEVAASLSSLPPALDGVRLLPDFCFASCWLHQPWRRRWPWAASGHCGCGRRRRPSSAPPCSSSPSSSSWTPARGGSTVGTGRRRWARRGGRGCRRGTWGGPSSAPCGPSSAPSSPASPTPSSTPSSDGQFPPPSQ